MNELFELPKVVYRRKNGQYATKEMAMVDKVTEENKYLRNESEKYRRMALALSNENAKLKDKLNKIKMMIL